MAKWQNIKMAKWQNGKMAFSFCLTVVLCEFNLSQLDAMSM